MSGLNFTKCANTIMINMKNNIKFGIVIISWAVIQSFLIHKLDTGQFIGVFGSLFGAAIVGVIIGGDPK